MEEQNHHFVASECPDIELLSAWFDGEEKLSDEQKEHIKFCSACARRLIDYKGISTGMKEGFPFQDGNKEMMERILSQTHCMIRKQLDTVRLEAQAKKRRRIVWGIRIGLLLVAIVCFILLMIREKKQSSPVKTVNIAPVTLKNPAFSAFHVPKQLRSYRSADAFSSTASPVELSLGASQFCVFDGEDKFLPQIPAYIPDKVVQFWYCTSFSAKQLEGHAATLKKEIGIKVLDASTSDDKQAYPLEITFEGNARQLAVMLKQLRAWGLDQLNLTAPRHDQYFFAGDGEGTVRARFFIYIPQDGGKYILPIK